MTARIVASERDAKGLFHLYNIINSYYNYLTVTQWDQIVDNGASTVFVTPVTLQRPTSIKTL